MRPLLKKPGLDSSDLKNYRPVSNLPLLSKVLERLVLKQLLSHLAQNDLNEMFQSAYRKHHSTETAILRVCNDFLKEADDRKVNLLVLLDLSAAFDRIDHNILIKRLECSFGVKGTALKWFASYLKNRTQSVKVSGFQSEKGFLQFGVPQGSVLGPVLFTMYTQPLVHIMRKFNILYHLYADDTQLYVSVYPNELPDLINRFEHCIAEVKAWMKVNKLKLNDEKTEVILLGNNNITKYVPSPSLHINDISLEATDKVKNLGVTIDKNLSMSFFISSLCKNSYVQLRKIASIRHCLTTEVTKTLVTSLVLSRLDYCNAVLAGTSKKFLSRLQVVQNNAARLILKKKNSTSATPLLKELHWLPIAQRIDYKCALLCFKCIHGVAPHYLRETLNFYKPRRSLRSTEDSFVLETPKTKLKSFGDRAFSSYGPRIWNSLPKRIRDIDKIEIFKKQLKHHLFLKTLCEE